MKIWIANITEPLSVEKNATLDRFGYLSQGLAERGHEVIWWTSNFSTIQRKFVFYNAREEKKDGVVFRILNSRGYRKENSIGQWLHFKQYAEKFYLYARQASRPDLVITSIPTLEVAETAMQYADGWGIPILVDVRDRWPFTRIEQTSAPFKTLVKYGLKTFATKYEFVCKTATGLIASSGHNLEFALKLAGREAGPLDGVFDAGQETLVQHVITTAETSRLKRAESVTQKPIEPETPETHPST